MMKSIFGAFSDVEIKVEDIAVLGNKYYIKNTLFGSQRQKCLFQRVCEEITMASK